MASGAPATPTPVAENRVEDVILPVSVFAFGPRPGWLALGGLRATRLWEPGAATNPTARPFELKGRDDHAETLAFSPDGRLLAAGGDDGKVLLWNL